MFIYITKLKRFTKQNNIVSILNELLYFVLDQCNLLNVIDKLESLEINSQSIITKIPRIYYNGNDITSKTSNIILNDNNTPKLH